MASAPLTRSATARRSKTPTRRDAYPIGEAATPTPPPFSTKRYCARFFALCAALWFALLAADAVLAHFSTAAPLLQPLWRALVARWPWLLGHPTFGGVVGAVAFFVACCGFSVLDITRSASTKIQKDAPWPTLREMAAAGVPQVVIYAAANAYSLVALPSGGAAALPALAPTLPTLGRELLVAFVVGDFFIYWEHRLMHAFAFTRTHIHSWHHAYYAPFSWAGGVVHPAEDAVVVVCQIAAPLALAHHPLSFWLFVFAWTVLLIEEHSGHDVRWAPYNWMPFASCPMGGGAAPHDIHHYKVRRGCPDRRAAAERPPRRRPRARARERGAGSPVADPSPAAPRR
jgi:sterol desaturase/sphingolipid hydroxylase (fatty acid hydroxylase superfamily)